MVYIFLLVFGAGFILKSRMKSADDYTKAGQSLSWPLVVFGFVLIPLGSGHTLSLWEASAGLGASVIWWGIIVGGIFLPLMMLWLAPWVRSLKVDTFPQVMEKIFGPEMHWLQSAVNIGTWTGIAMSETLATAAAIYGLSGGAIEYAPWCILIAFVLIIGYVFFGGVLQMAWLNVVNAIVMMIGSYLALIFTGFWLADQIGGWGVISNFYQQAGQGWKLEILNMSPDLFWQVVIPVAVLHISACAVSQNQYTPFFAAKSDQDCRKGVFLGALINSMACFPWIMMALVGMAIPAIAAGGAKLSVPNLAITALPAPIIGLLMISLLAATLSTGGSVVLAHSNIITNDIIKRYWHPKMSEKTNLKMMQIMVIVCGVMAAIPAFFVPIVFPVFLWCFSFGIPLFVIFFIGLRWKISKPAAWITIGVTYLLNYYWTFWTPSWAQGPWSLNMYPVTVVSIVLGVGLALLLPGEPGLMTKKRREMEKQLAPNN
jgi:SSS family solute:Na+ symporter